MRLLSVDWDYFFPLPSERSGEWHMYDWGHRESPLFIGGAIWQIRASDFLGREMPLPGTTGEETGFWQRFKFSPKAKMFVGESHAQITALLNRIVRDGGGVVFNFDAHHDAYHTPGEVRKAGSHSCEDWATYAAELGIGVVTVYPKWRRGCPDSKPQDNRIQIATRDMAFNRGFDAVFLCRSGAWVPTWLDDKFRAFVEDCPLEREEKGIIEREFDLAGAQSMADSMRGIREEYAQTLAGGKGTGAGAPTGKTVEEAAQGDSANVEGDGGAEASGTRPDATATDSMRGTL